MMISTMNGIITIVITIKITAIRSNGDPFHRSKRGLHEITVLYLFVVSYRTGCIGIALGSFGTVAALSLTPPPSRLYEKKSWCTVSPIIRERVHQTAKPKSYRNTNPRIE
jgi:hypothetical protein